MKPFKYVKAKKKKSAIQAAAAGGTYLAGGTNLVDLMKEDIAHPSTLVDVNSLKNDGIEKKGSSIIIGAGATNKDTANHKLIVDIVPKCISHTAVPTGKANTAVYGVQQPFFLGITNTAHRHHLSDDIIGVHSGRIKINIERIFNINLKSLFF